MSYAFRFSFIDTNTHDYNYYRKLLDYEYSIIICFKWLRRIPVLLTQERHLAVANLTLST